MQLKRKKKIFRKLLSLRELLSVCKIPSQVVNLQKGHPKNNKRCKKIRIHVVYSKPVQGKVC
jgi:hypothetical protein